jgi:MFS family permease
VTGLAVFTAASLWCGVAGSQETLIVARFFQGVGGAMASAVVLGMIVTMFPGPRERARAFGVFSFVGSAGASIGVLAGGVLTQALDWRWIFVVNLPIGLVNAALTVRVVEPDRGIRLDQGADIVGAFLVTAGLMLGVYTIVGASDHGWSSSQTLGFGTAAVVLLAGFVARQARAVNPLLPLRIFSSRNVSGANLIQALMVASALGLQFLAALYLQRVLGYGALATGLAFLPITVTIGTVSLGFSARLTTRLGARAVLVTGLIFLVAGLALLTGHRLTAATSQTSCRRCCCSAPGPACPFRPSRRSPCRTPHPATPGSPPAWSTPRSRSAARSASRS